MHRPTSVTVFGILNLVFAAMGICGLGVASFGMAFVANLPPDQAPSDPTFELLDKNAAFRVYTIATMGLGGIASIVLAVAGVGLLKMKSWARTLSIGYGVYAVLMQIVGIIVQVVFVIRPLMEKAEAGGAPETQAQMIGSIIGGACGGLFGLIYPVLLIVFLTRSNVVAAFQPESPELMALYEDSQPVDDFENPHAPPPA